MVSTNIYMDVFGIGKRSEVQYDLYFLINKWSPAVPESISLMSGEGISVSMILCLYHGVHIQSSLLC